MACSCLRLPKTAVRAAAPLPTPSPSSSQIVATISSHSKKARTRASDLSVSFPIERRSPFLGTQPAGLFRSRSLEIGSGERKQRHALRRAVSAELQSFDEDDEFEKRLRELGPSTSSSSGLASPSWFESSDWPRGQGIAMQTSWETTSGSCNLPVSLQMLKLRRKKQQQLSNWEESFRDAGESARSSVNNAFSTMVFMIRELHSYTLQMRQALFYEDIESILKGVQQDMHASFIWLFEQIFSCTPTLMVSLMLLLANFTVYSMTNPIGSAAPLPPPQGKMVAAVERNYEHKTKQPWFDQDASVGGSSGGGGRKVRLVAGSTGDGRSEGSSSSRRIPSEVTGDGDVQRGREEEEMAAWKRIVEEAKEMEAKSSDESLLQPTIRRRLVAPVTVQLEHNDYFDYIETELKYYKAMKQDPENSLLLSNFAQFLQLVLHDNERAECYYKKAVEKKPADAEALNKYATFLWVVKNDIAGAEETYQEALVADPGNSYHAAAYAHFLWNTGGEDTCFMHA